MLPLSGLGKPIDFHLKPAKLVSHSQPRLPGYLQAKHSAGALGQLRGQNQRKPRLQPPAAESHSIVGSEDPRKAAGASSRIERQGGLRPQRGPSPQSRGRLAEGPHTPPASRRATRVPSPLTELHQDIRVLLQRLVEVGGLQHQHALLFLDVDGEGGLTQPQQTQHRSAKTEELHGGGGGGSSEGDDSDGISRQRDRATRKHRERERSNPASHL